MGKDPEVNWYYEDRYANKKLLRKAFKIWEVLNCSTQRKVYEFVSEHIPTYR
jgi:hypothetical protein